MTESPKTPEMPACLSTRAEASPAQLTRAYYLELQRDVKSHFLPVLGFVNTDVAFSTLGVATPDAWVHDPHVPKEHPRPIIFNWRVLLGLTAHDQPFLCELIERERLALVTLVWAIAERAMRQYNVCTYEMFSRSIQAAYAAHIDPQKKRYDIPYFPLKADERPVLLHYLARQLKSDEFMAAVKTTFDRTFAPVLLPADEQEEIRKRFTLPDCVSMVSSHALRKVKSVLPPALDYPEFPRPPFGPHNPGEFLYELMYANYFRYRQGGIHVVTVPDELQPQALPPLAQALAINFNYYLPYREANMKLYNKLAGPRSQSIYDLSLACVKTFGRHYQNVLQDKNCGYYYEVMTRGLNLISPEMVETTFVIPLDVLQLLVDQAAKYSVNYLVGISAPKKRTRRSGYSRFVVSAKSILIAQSPPTPYLDAAEFQFVHRYGKVLISPPWPLNLLDINAFFGDDAPRSRVVQHAGRVFTEFDTLRRLDISQSYMTPELHHWLRGYVSLNSYEFKAELKQMNQREPLNKLVREEYGTTRVRFLPQEDEAIIRLYRSGMSKEARAELNEICFGRSRRSIAVRAAVLRKELMQKGVFDLDKLPHGARTEALLSELREEKKRQKRREAEATEEAHNG